MNPLNPLDAVFELGKTALEHFFPDPTKRAEEMRKLEELRQSGDLAKLQSYTSLLIGQLDINKEEAKSSSLFVSGWRPAVGWVCGLGLLYSSVLEPFLRFIATMLGYTGKFPIIDTTLTMQILLGMLGLAGARTYEKKQKVANK